MRNNSDSADARLAAARRYLSTVPILQDYTEQLAMHFGPGDQLYARLETGLCEQAEQIEAIHVALMVKHYTAAEIEGLTAFQSSAAGRGIMRKMGALQAELIQALSPILRRIIETAQQAVAASVAPNGT